MKKRPSAHQKKMIAPVVISILFLVYLVYSIITACTASAWEPVLLLFALPPVALGIGMVYALKSRIKEIRSGEEDDLNNY